MRFLKKIKFTRAEKLLLILLGCSLLAIGQSATPPAVAGPSRVLGSSVAAAPSASGSPLAADPELKLVVALFRHGVRAPLKEFYIHAKDHSAKEWPDLVKDWGVGPQGYGDLTPHGKDLATALGRYYAKEYRGQLGDSFSAFLWADVDQRNIDTAYALRDGFVAAGNSNVRVQVRPSNYGVDPLFHPFKADCGTPVLWKLQVIANEINLYAPRWIASLRTDVLQLANVLNCRGFPGERCKPFFFLADKATPWSPQHTRGSSPIEWKGRFPYASSASEAFLLEYATGMPKEKVGWKGVVPPNVGPSSLADMLRLHESYFDHSERQPTGQYPYYLPKIQGSNLIREILDQLKRKAGQTPDGNCPRADKESQFVGLIGHDTNLASVGSLLNLTWQFDDPSLPQDTRGLPANDALPAGALVFELRRRPGGYVVRVEYVMQSLEQMRNQTDGAFRLRVLNPACLQKVGPCEIPLEIFKEIAEPVIDRSFVSTCSSGVAPQQICIPTPASHPRIKKGKKSSRY